MVTHYDPSLPLKVAPNASPYDLWLMISHVTGEGENPMSCASRTLSLLSVGQRSPRDHVGGKEILLLLVWPPLYRS